MGGLIRAFFGLTFIGFAAVFVWMIFLTIANAPSSRSALTSPALTDNNLFQVTLVGQRLLPNDGILQGVIVVHLDSRALSQFVDSRTNTPIASCDLQGCSLLPGDGNRTISVVATSDVGFTRLSTFEVQVPLQSLLTPGLLTIPEDLSRPVNVAVSGLPAAYPADKYEFALTMYADISDTLNPKGTVFGAVPVVDLRALGPSLAVTTQGPMGKGGVHYLVDIARNPVVATYTYAVAAVPLTFALLFIHMLFINPASRTMPLADFLVALAATALAVLPLRAVLVPPEIGGLTQIDAILGVGILALVAVGLARYGRDLISTSVRVRPS